MIDRATTLASLLPSTAMARLVVFFPIHPGQQFHLRELERRARLPNEPLRRELQRLVDVGAVASEEGDDDRV